MMSFFLKNDEKTTGILNNISEIIIHLLTGQLLYFHKEQEYLVDLTHDYFVGKLEEIVTIFDSEMP